MSSHPDCDASTAMDRRQTATLALGNMLEVYDFLLYGFLAPVMAQQFFPATDPLSSLLLTFMVFGAGFIMRPLGAVVLGRLADRHGRLVALQWSIGLMGAGTLLFVLAPTYAQIGSAAGWLLLLGRLLQGFSMGGEISASAVALLEGGPASSATRRVSWQFASQGAGSTLAAIVVLLLGQCLPAAAFASWGWRLAFALGLLLVPVAWAMRRQLAAAHVPPLPAGSGLWPAQRQRLLWSTLLITGSTAGVYLMLTFLPAYLSEQRGWPKAIGQLAALAAGITIMLASPWFGRLADRLREPASLVRPALACAMLLVPLLFWFVQQDRLQWLLIPLVVLYMLATVAMTVSGLTVLMQGFAPAHRTLATGIVYSVGVTLFGGFSGAIVLKLLAVTGSAWMPALYLLLALATSWLALSRLQRLSVLP